MGTLKSQDSASFTSPEYRDKKTIFIQSFIANPMHQMHLKGMKQKKGKKGKKEKEMHQLKGGQ